MQTNQINTRKFSWGYYLKYLQENSVGIDINWNIYNKIQFGLLFDIFENSVGDIILKYLQKIQ